MSGKERCVNPNCTQYGEIQEGACTLRPLIASGGWGAPPTTEHGFWQMPGEAPATPRSPTVVYEERMHLLEMTYFGNQTGDVMNGVTVKLCQACGALAGNTRRHARWHEDTRTGLTYRG